MPPKEIHEDFMKTLGMESPYSTVKKWAAEFNRGRESVEDDGWSGLPKDATADENVKVVHTIGVCDRRRAGKVMASIFWDGQGVIMIDILEQGRTINVAYYAGELRRLYQKIARKRRGN